MLNKLLKVLIKFKVVYETKAKLVIVAGDVILLFRVLCTTKLNIPIAHIELV